jgi:hypothetical protein
LQSVSQEVARRFHDYHDRLDLDEACVLDIMRFLKTAIRAASSHVGNQRDADQDQLRLSLKYALRCFLNVIHGKHLWHDAYVNTKNPYSS